MRIAKSAYIQEYEYCFGHKVFDEDHSENYIYVSFNKGEPFLKVAKLQGLTLLQIGHKRVMDEDGFMGYGWVNITLEEMLRINRG